METLSALLPNEIAGYRATGTMLLEVLIYAATEGTSLHGACALLDGVADDTTLRGYLNAAFPKSKVDALSRGGKTVVLSSVPEVVFERRQRVAIDLKDFAYYGKDGSLGMWLNRCKATAGTTRCLRAATASVVRDFGDGRQGPGGHGQRPRQRYAAHAGFGGPLLVDQNESANY